MHCCLWMKWLNAEEGPGVYIDAPDSVLNREGGFYWVKLRPEVVQHGRPITTLDDPGRACCEYHLRNLPLEIAYWGAEAGAWYVVGREKYVEEKDITYFGPKVEQPANLA